MLNRATRHPSSRRSEALHVVGLTLANSRTRFNSGLLGPGPSSYGDTERYVAAEILSTHEYALAPCRLFLGVCTAYGLDRYKLITENETIRSVKQRPVRPQNREKAYGQGAVVPAELHQGSEVGRQRSLEIVRAAYLLLAEKGFEGLRTREVAAKVGINSATLHYYFPNKEALIQGVVIYLMQELSQSRVVVNTSASALKRLRAEFADIRARLQDAPEQLVVLTELAVRAWRDPAIANMLQRLDEGWHSHLVLILQAGIEEKAFRKDFDVAATANLLMSQLRGLGYQGKVDIKKLDSLIDHIALQTEHWVRK